MLLSCVRATRLGEKGRMSRCKKMNGRSCTSTYSGKFKVPSHMRMKSVSTTVLQSYQSYRRLSKRYGSLSLYRNSSLEIFWNIHILKFIFHHIKKKSLKNSQTIGPVKHCCMFTCLLQSHCLCLYLFSIKADLTIFYIGQT